MATSNEFTDRMQIFSMLPMDLIVAVVLRLPMKSVLRFRCVSKFFYHLITPDGPFARSYSEISRKSTNFVVPSLGEHMRENYELEDLDTLVKMVSYDLRGELGDSRRCRFIFRDDRYSNLNLAGCCDGVLCFYMWRRRVMRYQFSLDFDLMICLCNPGLNQVTVLPGKEFLCWSPDRTKVCFVRDNVAHDCKVVVIRDLEIFIYSLKDNTWKSINTSIKTGHGEIHYRMLPGSPNSNLVVHNGSPHWLSLRQGREHQDQELVVNVLDMTQETVGEIRLPEDLSADIPDLDDSFWPPLRDSDRDSSLHLERYKGRLALTYDDLQFWDPVVELWVMQEGMNWVKCAIRMDLPHWIYDDEVYEYGRICRTAWATTSWTYMITDIGGDESTVLFTDVEDAKSAEKCRIGTGRLGPYPGDNSRFYAVADYVVSFVSVMPPDAHDHAEG